MGKVKCSVLGCEDKESRQSIFPHPISIGRFKVWLDISQNPFLVDSMSFEDVYKKERICHRHFEDSCFSVGSHISLKYDSIPTKYISGGAPTITDGHRRLMSTDMQPSNNFAHFHTVASGSRTRKVPEISLPAVEASVDAITAAYDLLDASLLHRQAVPPDLYQKVLVHHTL